MGFRSHHRGTGRVDTAHRTPRFHGEDHLNRKVAKSAKKRETLNAEPQSRRENRNGLSH
jgi:hypothetical protein